MRALCGAAVHAVLLVWLTASAAYAQIAVSANDGKVRLVNGRVEVQATPRPDTATFIDMRTSQPKVLAEIAVPNSVFGPPSNVAISPKEDIALIASGMQIDPADKTRLIPDDRVTVLDLSPLKPTLVSRIRSAVGAQARNPAAPPKVVATLEAGKGASGIAINKTGTLALVANRAEGTVSVLSISGTTVRAIGKVTVGDEGSHPSAVAFTPDGKRALVTTEGDNRIAVLSIDGTKVEAAERVIAAGLRPSALDIAASGDVAVVANSGIGGGDADTISVIDLRANPPRVVGTYTVGQTPSGVRISPNGRYVAITVTNGSDKAPSSPFYRDSSLLQVWSRSGTQLAKAGEISLGKWCQGVAWSRNSRTLLVQCMVEEEISIVRFSGLAGRSLQKVGAIKVKGGPAGIRSVGR